MEIGHDEETDNGDDDAPELYFLVGGDTAREIVGDGLIE